jgi:hypothetical protein
MATMGRREVKKPNSNLPQESPLGIGAPAVNLTASPIVVQPVSTLGIQPSFWGTPIMREGFITITGFMPPKLA